MCGPRRGRGGGHHEDSGFQLICVLCPQTRDLLWCLWNASVSMDLNTVPRGSVLVIESGLGLGPPLTSLLRADSHSDCSGVWERDLKHWALVVFYIILTPYRVILLYIKNTHLKIVVDKMPFLTVLLITGQTSKWTVNFSDYSMEGEAEQSRSKPSQLTS